MVSDEAREKRPPLFSDAIRDWAANRLYIDGNGNWRLKAVGRNRGPIVRYNLAIKSIGMTPARLQEYARDPEVRRILELD